MSIFVFYDIQRICRCNSDQSCNENEWFHLFRYKNTRISVIRVNYVYVRLFFALLYAIQGTGYFTSPRIRNKHREFNAYFWHPFVYWIGQALKHDTLCSKMGLFNPAAISSDYSETNQFFGTNLDIIKINWGTPPCF